MEILQQGQAHIKTITVQGEAIEGLIDLEKCNLHIQLVVDSQVYSSSSYVLKGYDVVRKATIQDHHNLRTNSTWGYLVIINSANRLLTK